MSNSSRFVAAFLCVIFAAASSVEAGAKYKTKFKDFGGNTQNALVDIDGADGTYTLDNGMTGTLSDLKLDNIGGQNVLRGKWTFGNRMGKVTWKMDGTLDTMDGTWTSGNQMGSWKGSFDSGMGSIGNMGPRKM